MTGPTQSHAASAREEAFALLDKLCQDSLEVPLSVVLAHPKDSNISAMFARLFDLIEEMTA